MSSQKLQLAIVFIEICQKKQQFGITASIEARKKITQALSIVAGHIARHSGSLIKIIGDQILCTYPNSKKAIQSASDIQKGLHDDLSITQAGIYIKIAAHFGSIFLDGNDIAGETVDFTEKLLEAAKAHQILTTRITMQNFPAEFCMNINAIGKIKPNATSLSCVEIFEVLWQVPSEGEGEGTMIQGSVEEEREHSAGARLILEFRGKKYELSGARPSFLFGRGNQNDIIIDNGSVSRNHATIQYREGKFILIDQSTNGTYLRTETRENFFLHQEEIHLHARGIISIGQSVSKSNPDLIYFMRKK
ncbi:MAG: adenylate cyclase [bacterium]|jgi:adenylate cyclase